MKTKSKKILWAAVSLLIVALLACSVLFVKYVNEPAPPIPEASAPAVDENGNELDGDKVHPLPKAMTFTRTTKDEGVKISATVKPETTQNKKLNWSLSFVNPSSEWATGKTVTDYVTVTPSDTIIDATSTATLKCLQDFGEQIKLTVTSEQNPEAKAECTIDFKQKFLGYSLRMYIDEQEGGKDKNYYYFFGSEYATEENKISNKIMPSATEFISGEFESNCELSNTYTVAAVAGVDYKSFDLIEFKPTEEFKTMVQGIGLNPDDLHNGTLIAEWDDSPETFFDREWFELLVGSDKLKLNKLIQGIMDYTGAAYNLIFTNSGEAVATFEVEFDPQNLLSAITVEEIELDNSNIVF